MSPYKPILPTGVPPAASRGRQRRAGGATAPLVLLSASPAAARPAGSANFSWSFVMVTWRCCGYITANDWARSALHAELLTVWPSCLSVCDGCLLQCLPLTGRFIWCSAGWQFDSWLSDRKEKSGVTASRGSFFRGIMSNVELWLLLPFDSWQGEREGGGLFNLLDSSQSECLNFT